MFLKTFSSQKPKYKVKGDAQQQEKDEVNVQLGYYSL